MGETVGVKPPEVFLKRSRVKTTHETFTHGIIFWIFNEKDRYQKSFDRMENAYETCGRDGSAGDFPGDKLFNFE